MTWPILKYQNHPGTRVLSLTRWRELFSVDSSSSPSPFPSSSIPLLFPRSFLFIPSLPQGLREYIRSRGESHPLSLLSQAQAREYVVAPFSSTLWCPPRSGYPWSSNLLPRAARGSARCIRMFLQLTRTLCVLITAERALKERHHLRPPCKWATPRKITRVSCRRYSLSLSLLISELSCYICSIGEFERRSIV